MKKRTAVVSMLLVFSMTLTGCSWSDFTSKLPWNSGSTEEADYNVEDCITMGDYKGLEVDISVTDEEVQSELDTLLSNKETTKKITDRKVAKSGDVANIDYVGKIDGKTFEGGSAEKSDLTLGSNSFIDGFEDGVVGMKVGSKKTLKLKFPADYSSKDLAGKNVEFTVKLNSISKTVTPKLTDKFVKENSSYKTIAEFKKGKKEEIRKQNEADKGSSAFGDFLQNKVTVKTYPESLLKKYKTYYDTYWKSYLTAQGYDFDTFLTQSNMTEADYNKQVEDVAKDLAKSYMTVRLIAQKEGIEISDTDKQNQIKTMMQSGNVEDQATLAEQVKSYYGLDLDTFILDGLYENKVIEFVASKVKVKG